MTLRTKGIKSSGALKPYRAKRDFAQTPEPRGTAAEKSDAALFVVQKHAARRLHYDFRLEMGGTLKSWAVTRGPSLNPMDRRLAVHVEDHPLDYANFEGTIPKGQYGGGTVMVWDQGRWIPDGDPEKSYRRGKLDFTLRGKKLKGAWTLVRMKSASSREKRDNWLLIKRRDAAASDDGDRLMNSATQSALTGRSMEEIAQGDAVWHSNHSEKPTAEDLNPNLDRLTMQGKRAPMPDVIAPQLALLSEYPPPGDDWLHEMKFDGYRLMIHLRDGKARILTRRGLDWTKKFVKLAHTLERLPVSSAILDGEAMILGPNGLSDFGLLQEALAERNTEHVQLYLFDLLYLNGRDLRKLPLIERKTALGALLSALGNTHIHYSDHLIGEGTVFFRQACAMKLEGVVSKRRDSPYCSGRGSDWRKSKCGHEQEFVIGGFTDSSNAHRSIGALLVGYYEGGRLIYAGKVGTGFSDAVAQSLHQDLDKLTVSNPPFDQLNTNEARCAHWVKPHLVCEVEFQGWTRDGKIRHAAVKGLRLDKPPKTITREEPVPSRGVAPAPSGVTLTNPGRVLYPEQGLTKQDIADYYQDIAAWILPHVRNRPLSLVRCPGGRHKECFYQKHLTQNVEGLGQIAITEKSATRRYAYIENLDGLISLVQMGVLEIHPWGCRIDDIEKPDRVVFDLDPHEAVAWPDVIATSKLLRDYLLEMGLKSFLKTTGGKGLHVVVPLARRQSWDEVKQFSEHVAKAMAREAPDRYVATMSKKARDGRIFIDYLRNSRGSTAVAAYSPRARENAPVSTPLHWKELTANLRSDHFTVANIRQRLDHLADDPWAGIEGLKQSITSKMRRAVGIRND